MTVHLFLFALVFVVVYAAWYKYSGSTPSLVLTIFMLILSSGAVYTANKLF